ncbi:hypothetical protein D3C80_2083650 [compost metagenome]
MNNVCPNHLRLLLFDLTIECLVHLDCVQRPDPFGNRHGAHTIADGIGDCPRFRHEPVDAQQQHHARNGNGA